MTQVLLIVWLAVAGFNTGEIVAHKIFEMPDMETCRNELRFIRDGSAKRYLADETQPVPSPIPIDDGFRISGANCIKIHK